MAHVNKPLTLIAGSLGLGGGQYDFRRGNAILDQRKGL